MSSSFSIEETSINNGAKIIAVGVGGGGGNMIAHMVHEGVEGIEMVIANTDVQALETSFAATKIQMGVRLTKGLGAGMKPSVGKDSAIESYDDIRQVLDGADIVFIAAGLGGGTGTGAAPIIAQVAKEVGALTISVVTKPFTFEGAKRMKLAEQGLEDLKRESDSIVVIPNDKILSIIDAKLGIKESYKVIDSVLSQAVSGTSGVILSSGENDMNLDFADLKTVMSHPGMALMGVGEHTGENAAYEAIKTAIESPLLDSISINGAMGVLTHFTIHPDFPLLETSNAMQVVYESADDNADIIFGTTCDSTLPVDYVKITLVATGFDQQKKERSSSANNDIDSSVVESSQITQIKSRPKMVVGGEINDDILEVPTYIRNQKD